MHVYLCVCACVKTIIQAIQNNNNNNSYRFLLPGGRVPHPDHEIELHASPNVNLETE